MKAMVVTAVVGIGMLFAAGCDCACKKNACKPPRGLREQLATQTAPVEYPAVTFDGEMSVSAGSAPY